MIFALEYVLRYAMVPGRVENWVVIIDLESVVRVVNPRPGRAWAPFMGGEGDSRRHHGRHVGARRTDVVLQRPRTQHDARATTVASKQPAPWSHDRANHRRRRGPSARHAPH